MDGAKSIFCCYEGCTSFKGFLQHSRFLTGQPFMLSIHTPWDDTTPWLCLRWDCRKITTACFFHGKTLSNVGFFSNSWSNMGNPSHVLCDLVWCRLWDAISIWCLCCYILCCTWILCNSWWTSSFRTWQMRVARGVNDVGSPSHTPCSQLTMWGYHC